MRAPSLQNIRMQIMNIFRKLDGFQIIEMLDKLAVNSELTFTSRAHSTELNIMTNHFPRKRYKLTNLLLKVQVSEILSEPS